MFWPSAQDYNEAIQNPSTSFADRDLRRGTVESNRLGLPKVMSGAFASVYQINSGESPWAVRCFLNNRPDHQERYKFISDFVLFDDLECTVPFYYLEEGIKIKGSWYPILKMEWVEGRTLEKFLDENFNKKHVVLDLLRQFDEMVLDLNRAGIAHGDLQHGNIIVTEQGLRLVDYDALYVPALKGWQSPEVGHPNFQHPHRSANHFNPSTDNFSAWLIHFSLLALSIDPELYRIAEGGDDSILFKRSDFLNPRKSDLFKILVEHPATELRQAGLILASMLAVDPTAVPGLNAGVDELCILPDMSSLFLEDFGEDGDSAPLQSLNSSDNHSDRVSKLLPRNISAVGHGADQIVREAFDPASVRNSKESMQLRLALLSRNFSANIRSSANGWYLKRFPRQWCQGKLKRATGQFKQCNYEVAVPIFLEVADVLDLLANQQSFWITARKALRKLLSQWIFFAIFACLVTAIIYIYGLNPVSIFASFFFAFPVSIISSLFIYFFLDALKIFLVRKLHLTTSNFEPEKLLVESHLSLGYCFCFNNQWRVASNFFSMALRGCKWGIDPELRKRSLLLYAVCRNEGGERKEAIRFLLQKPEVIESLPSLVDAENRSLQLTKRLSAFQLFFELGQSYVRKRLTLSAVPPLLAAKGIYELLSEEDRLQSEESAREMFLTLAYIYTIRSNWPEAQNTFNELILHCSKFNVKALWAAEFCAALSSNLRGDLTGATALMLRCKFRPGELLNEIVDKESISHKILFYDRSRGSTFLQELGARLHESNRSDRLMEICSILMYMFRCDVAPRPVFRISWFDELDDEFIAACLRRSYFDNRQPTSNELTVLIDAAVAASLTKTILILGQVMLKDNMLDRVDHLLNRMDALRRINNLVQNEEDSSEGRVDRFFVDIILRLASEPFKDIIANKCIAKLGFALDVEHKEKLTVETVLDCILHCAEGSHKSVSDIIYGAFDSPSIFKNEFLQYRGILRFVELYLANRLVAFDMFENALILYDRLEGYYSVNIDRVLDRAISKLEQTECSDVVWLERVVATSNWAGLYRGGADGRHLTQIKGLVSERITSQFASCQLIANWQTTIAAVESYDRASFAVLDTICDTAMILFQESISGSRNENELYARSELVDEICRFMLTLGTIYLEHGAPTKFAKQQTLLIDHVDKVSNQVALPLRLLVSILLRVTGLDREAAAILAGVLDSEELLEYVLLSEEPIVKMLLRGAGLDALDLFVQAGDIERDDDSRARCFYLTAASLYNSLPLSTANRALSQKLSARLGHPPGTAQIELELLKYREPGTERKLKHPDEESGEVDGNKRTTSK